MSTLLFVFASVAFAGCLVCTIWTTFAVNQMRADQEKLQAISEQLGQNAQGLKLALTPGQSKS